MNMILNILNNWSNYEKLSTGLMLLAILFALILSVYFFTKSIRVVIVSGISLLKSIFLTTLILFLSNQFFNLNITEIYSLVFVVIIFLNILSIGTMVGYYTLNHKSKDFTLLDLKKENVKDGLKLSISVILLFSGLSILAGSLLIPFLMILGISLAMIWINYLLVSLIIK